MTPTAVRHEPQELGGLDLLNLCTESGISRVKKYMFDAIYRQSEAGKLILLNVKAAQLESGLCTPLLEHPSIHIPYATHTWTTSLRSFLDQHQLRITLTGHLQVQFKGKWDRTIMSLEVLTRYSLTQQKDINCARIYLQVIQPCPFGIFSIELSKFRSGRTNQFVNQLRFLS